MFPDVSTIKQFLDRNPKTILVRVSATRGSTPRETGAWMLVSHQACLGSIGGGDLEWQAMRKARNLLDDAGVSFRHSSTLGPQTGQCCGGQVDLDYVAIDPATKSSLLKSVSRAEENRPTVYIFGAGHVGRAIALALAPLPLTTILVDQRAGELSRDQSAARHVCTAIPESVLEDSRPGSAYVIVTHDHGLDFLIADALLKKQDTAYIGMIGSKTKRNRFRARFLEEGGSPDRFEKLVCPMGASASANKAPAVIAAAVASELVDTIL